jgi:hypothetical protein
MAGLREGQQMRALYLLYTRPQHFKRKIIAEDYEIMIPLIERTIEANAKGPTK